MGKKKRPALKAGKSSTRSVSDQIADSLLETFVAGSAHDSRRTDASLEDVEHFDDANSCDSDCRQPPVVPAPSKSERKKTAAHLSEELPQPNRPKVIASENEPVRWTTPLGLPVVQPYFKTQRRVSRAVT